jgi:hypothetical protein
MTYFFTYHLVPLLAPKYKQHSLSPAKVRKVGRDLEGGGRDLILRYYPTFAWRD